MSRKGIHIIFSLILILVFISVSTSCEKLKISRLRANHHFTRANSLFGENKYRDAIEEYERALIYDPNLIEAYRFLGESYKNLYRPAVDTPENMERANKALEALTRAYEIDPLNREIIYSLGDMYDKMKNFEEAEKLYLKIIEMEPAQMNNYYVVAGFYKRYSGENEELGKKAEEMYLRRIEVDPDHPEGYAYLAQYYGELRPIPEFDKAFALTNLLIKLDPDNYIHYYSIGVNRFSKAYRLQNVLSIEERRSLADQSREALEKSIELEPNYSFSYAYLNILYRNVYARVYPQREKRYLEEADRWQERFQDVRRRELERERLERELRGVER